MKHYKYYDIVMASFVATLLLSNIASSAKLISWGSIGGFELIFDAGTLLFPLSYIFGDILTEVYGYARARRVIWTGFAWSVVMSLFFLLVQRMPGPAFWAADGDTAYSMILGSVSSGGIIVASLAAYFMGEFSNSYVLAKMKILQKGKALWMRTIGSTLVGQVFDSVGFVVIACSLGVFGWSEAWNIIVTIYIMKVAIEVLFTPVTYRIVGFLKREEKEDFYDTHTAFNPFAAR